MKHTCACRSRLVVKCLTVACENKDEIQLQAVVFITTATVIALDVGYIPLLQRLNLLSLPTSVGW